VLSIGGNANRATHTDSGVRVDVLGDPETFFRFPAMGTADGQEEPFSVERYYDDPQRYFADGNKEPFVPAEIWRSEIFSPPYLQAAEQRPQITQAPAQLSYGQAFELAVSTPSGSVASGAVLVKLGSVTHSFDVGQRLAPLAPAGPGAEGRLSLRAPENAHLYPPGYYMLFCLDEAGIPSVARMVRLGVPS
jgi:hypothetical protein